MNITPLILCFYAASVFHMKEAAGGSDMIIFWDGHLSCSHRHSQMVVFTDVIFCWKSRLKDPTLYLFSSLYLSSCTPLKQPGSINFPKKKKKIDIIVTKQWQREFCGPFTCRQSLNSIKSVRPETLFHENNQWFNLLNSTVKLNFTLSIKLSVSPFCMTHSALPLPHFLSLAPWHTCGVSIWVLICLWAFAVSLVLCGFTYELKPLKENTSNPFFLSLWLPPPHVFFNSYPFITWPQ